MSAVGRISLISEGRSRQAWFLQIARPFVSFTEENSSRFVAKFARKFL